MTTLEFEACLDDDVIHVPEAIARQLAKEAALRVSLQAVEALAMTPDEAWASVLAFIAERDATLPPYEGELYQWNHDEVYDHLKKYYHDPDSTD